MSYIVKLVQNPDSPIESVETEEWTTVQEAFESVATGLWVAGEDKPDSCSVLPNNFTVEFTKDGKVCSRVSFNTTEG